MTGNALSLTSTVGDSLMSICRSGGEKIQILRNLQRNIFHNDIMLGTILSTQLELPSYYFPIYYVEPDEKFDFMKEKKFPKRMRKAICEAREMGKLKKSVESAAVSSLNLQHSCFTAHSLPADPRRTCASNSQIALLCDFNVPDF